MSYKRFAVQDCFINNQKDILKCLSMIFLNCEITDRNHQSTIFYTLSLVSGEAVSNESVCGYNGWPNALDYGEHEEIPEKRITI